MTDKQIIIECSYKGECQMMGCLNDENCFIKQLFEERYRAERELYRKEQECEELKAELELFKTSNQTTIDQFKAETDVLFKAIEEVNKINKRLESENEELKETIQLQNKMQMEVCKEKNTELDQLKKQLESTKGLVTVGNRQLAEALKENEEFKKILHYPKYRNEEGIKELKTKSIDYLINEIVGNHQYMEGKSQAVYKPMLIENKKLKQTLTEIKNIAYDGYNNGQTSYATFQCEKIINKINEVEDVNNNR